MSTTPQRLRMDQLAGTTVCWLHLAGGRVALSQGGEGR